MRLGSLLPGLAVALAMAGPVPARTLEPVPTTLTLSATPVYADRDTPLLIELVREDATPVADAHVAVERRVDGGWQSIGDATTDDAGRGELPVTLARIAADNVFRASYAGGEVTGPSETGPVQIQLVRRTSRLTIGGSATVVDETSVVLRIRWTTGNGLPVEGVVTLQRRVPGQDWEARRDLRTGSDGRVQLEVAPRVDTRWRAVADPLDWVDGARSEVHAIDNLPPGLPVRLPDDAPEPTVSLPEQARALGEGANPVVSEIPRRIWRQMNGRSWHQGCPVGRADLRRLQINYWDFTGYRRRGELIANKDAVQAMSEAFADLYARKLPLRSMYRVDRFGWSDRLGGADNFASMSADNTSAFNCRQVVGDPDTRSPHSWGRSVDLNPWENPYRSRLGEVPNTWWLAHAHPRVAWRSTAHAVVEAMAAQGLVWTYGLGDAQHFDAD